MTSKVRIPSLTNPTAKQRERMVQLGSKPGRAGSKERERIAEFRGRLISTTGHRVIDEMIAVALDRDHPNQVTMLKFIGDRILPLEQFTSQADKERGATVFNITLQTAKGTIKVNPATRTIEAEEASFREVDNDD